MIFPILTTITIAVIVAIIISIVKENYEDMVGWILTFLLVGVFGWGFVGVTFPHIPFKKLHTVTVLTEPTVVHISHNGKIVKTFTDVATYQFLSKTNKSEMLAIGYTNIYGKCHIDNWEFPNVLQ